MFDLPSDLDSVVEDHWADGQFDTLTKATSLPELIDDGYGGGRGEYDFLPEQRQIEYNFRQSTGNFKIAKRRTKRYKGICTGSLIVLNSPKTSQL